MFTFQNVNLNWHGFVCGILQQQTQFIVQQTGQSPNQRMQKVPAGAPGTWFMQQQQQQGQQQQQQSMLAQGTDINQVGSILLFQL